MKNLIPKVLPGSWKIISEALDGFAIQDIKRGIRMIISVSKELDGKRWMHISLSRAKQLPTWDDMKFVKDILVGENKKAIQVLPPKSEYVNIHPYVLHLWHCLDDDGLPDFTRGSKSI